MKIPYAIGRIKKLHLRDISNAANHNYRTRSVPNAAPHGTIIPLLGADTADRFTATLAQRFEEWKARKISASTGKRGAKMARDPVVCVEVMLTASPEYFRPECPDKANYWEVDKLKAWEAVIKEYAKAHFGKNLVSLVLHLDEATPHAHALVMPFDSSENLNAKQVFNRVGLVRLQDTYADACKSLGLQRGLRGSIAKHDTVKEFYGVVNRETPAVEIERLKPKGPPIPGKIDRLDDDKLKAYAASVFKAGAKAAAKAYEEKIQTVSAKAEAYDLSKRKEASVSKALEETRKMANEVRALPLSEVLLRLGATHDSAAHAWLMPSRRITLNTTKFYDHEHQKGGGGAIDLVMHCEGVDFTQAVSWLALEFGKSATVGDAMRATQEQVTHIAATPAPLPIPAPCPEYLPRVVDYLTKARRIPQELVQSLVQAGKVYADKFANCVFKMTTDTGEEGAELRGTGDILFHGVRGTKGFFVLPPSDPQQKQAVFVKSAIDALSYRALHPLSGWIYSTAGFAVKRLRALARNLSKQKMTIVSGFDDSREGRQLSLQLSQAVGQIEVEKPFGVDWNDCLVAKVEAAHEGNALSRFGLRRRLNGPNI